MRFEVNDIKYVKERLNSLLKDENVRKMKKFKQHGIVNTYEHCLNVAIMSYILVKKLGISVNMDELLRGAMLHDFYLYDWHNGRIRYEGIHAFSHPKIALNNAKRCFHLSKKEEDIIRNHMFPMTILHCPKSKEAFIVTVADKICASCETLDGGFIKGTTSFLFPKLSKYYS